MIQNNRFFTSSVAGCYITLYFTGCLLFVMVVLWVSFMTQKEVMARQWAKYVRRQKGLPSEIRSGVASKVGSKVKS